MDGDRKYRGSYRRGDPQNTSLPGWMDGPATAVPKT
jgi:hypothetical protein